MSWVPTWKSLPNSPKCRTGRLFVSCFPALKFELASFARHTRVELETEGIIPSGLLWETLIREALYQPTLFVENRYLAALFPALDDAAIGEVFHSRVAAAPAGAGKLRLVICDR